MVVFRDGEDAMQVEMQTNIIKYFSITFFLGISNSC